ncbi:hypothetical protein [Azospirillum melinis]
MRQENALSRGSQRIFDPPDAVSTNFVCARGGRGRHMRWLSEPSPGFELESNFRDLSGHK